VFISKMAFGKPVEESVEVLRTSGCLVSKVEKPEELFVAEMQRRQRGASICVAKLTGQHAEPAK
jgi:hypothetical protein